jgi:AcrR family transcriptional regulator
MRTGQQARSKKTQGSLLDAAAMLFSEKGVDATSVADVAERAGCSVGAVYHHFRDKKALLYALFDRMSKQYRATTRDAVDPARWEGASIADILRGYLEFSLEIGRDRPAFKRAGLEASRNDPALREHLAELHSELDQGLTELLLARRNEVGHPDPVLATGFVLDQLGSMLKTRLDEILLPTQLAARSDEEFVREALRSACAYLQVEPPIDLKNRQ